MSRPGQKGRLQRPLVVEQLEERWVMAISVGDPGVPAPSDPGSYVAPAFHSTVPAERLAVLDRGINISRWFRDPDAPTADWFTNHVTDADLQQIRDLGFHHVRLPIWPIYLFHAGQSSTPDPTVLGYLDAAIDRILAHDLAVVIDIHDEEQLPEQGAAVVNQFVAFWGALAGHLSQFNPDRVFFEVLNEPVFYDDPQDWFPIQERILTAMRTAAPQNTLIADAPRWSNIEGLLFESPVADTNVVYTFHFYDPFLFTHQGAPWTDPSYEHLRGLPYPATIANTSALAAKLQATLHDPDDSWIPEAVREYGRQGWNAAKLETDIRRAIDWAAANGVPLYAGEFGVHRDGGVGEADRDRWHHDVVAVFAKYHVGWAMWDYDENFGLVQQTDCGRVLDVSLAKALGLLTPALPPVNQFPSGLTINEDAKLVFTAKVRDLKVVNPNATAFPIELTLTVSHGVFTLAKKTGLTFAAGDGTADATMRFQGSAAAVAAALAGANFQPDRDYFGTASIAMTSRLVGAATPGASGQAADFDLITINVRPVNDAPVLTASRITLPPGLFGTTPHAGIAVSALLAGHVTDADPGAAQGIALAGIGVNQKTGWEFSLDGGATWKKVVAASTTSALLLRASDRLRFVGTATAANAGPLTFAAWDQTTGAAGQRANILAPHSGGATAFSITRAVTTLAVTPSGPGGIFV